MRASVPGLASPTPIVEQLPGVFQEDAFTRSFVSAFDEVLAPIFATLDSLDAYVDPRLTPDDFLDWLAGWVGITVDEDWPLERQRTLVGSAVSVYRLRGTAAGLKAEVEIYTQGTVEVVENGACVWSLAPNAPLPGTPNPHVIVRVRAPQPERISRRGLEDIVAGAKPAHVPHQIELTANSG